MKTLILLFIASAITAQTPDFSKYKKCEYLEQAHELAVLVYFKYDIPVSVTMAVSILESGYGTSNAARTRCNYFGMNRGQKKYISMYESFIDFGYLLRSKKRYKPLSKIDRNDYILYCEALRACGYNWREEYPKKLIKIIKMYRLNEL